MKDNLFRVSFLTSEASLHQILVQLGHIGHSVLNVEVHAVEQGPPSPEVRPKRKSTKGVKRSDERGHEIVHRITASAEGPVSIAVLRREFESLGRSPYSVDSAVTEARDQGLVKRVKVHGQKGFIQAVKSNSEATS